MLTLMKFYADWCKPCTAMMPVMEKVKAEFNGEVIFVDIDIENNPQVRSDYHIRSIPAFVLLREGKEIARKTGSASATELTSWLEEYDA